MAITTALLFLSVIIHTTLAQRVCNIPQGSSLTPTSETPWLSPSGLYAFGFYPQGNNSYGLGITIAKIPEKTVVWTSNRDLPLYSINSTLVLTHNGNFIVTHPERGYGGQTIAGTIGEDHFDSASMLDNGNFVLCNSNGQIAWRTFEHPTDTILTGQRLLSGQELVSSASGGGDDYSSGIFRLAMQQDGNLVQYPRESSNHNHYWASSTFGYGDRVLLKLDPGGHLRLLKTGGSLVKSLTKEETKRRDVIFLARIDADGIFRTYSHDLGKNGKWSIVWESLKEKCVPRGLCGLNGYCDLIDGNAVCKCLPHFNFVDRDKWRYGCDRNFASQSCPLMSDTKGYDMMEVNDTIWEDVSYLTLFSITKEDCKKSCFEDCNCEAALYIEGKCMKKRLPLRYGRRLINAPQIFIKVGRSLAPSLNEIPSRGPNGFEKIAKKNTSIIWVAIGAFSFCAIAIWQGSYTRYRRTTRSLVM